MRYDNEMDRAIDHGLGRLVIIIIMVTCMIGGLFIGFAFGVTYVNKTHVCPDVSQNSISSYE